MNSYQQMYDTVANVVKGLPAFETRNEVALAFARRFRTYGNFDQASFMVACDASKIPWITVEWMGGGERVLVIEDHVADEGWWSATELGDPCKFYRVGDDGTVGDDAGDGDWFGNVKDWRGLKDAAHQ